MSNLFSDVYNFYDRNVRQGTGEIVNPLLNSAAKGLKSLNDSYVKSGAADAVRYVAPWAPDPRKGYGDLPRTRKTSSTEKPRKGGLRNFGSKYAKLEKEMGEKAEKYRPGAGFPGQQKTTSADTGEQDSNVTSRNVSRNGATGTQTGPSPARFDGTEGMDSFMSELTRKYGIRFDGQGGRGPMQSSSLPQAQENVRRGIAAGQEANATETPVIRGVTAGMEADKAEASNLTAALADQEGMRSYMDRAIKKGREESDGTGPMAYATDGLDARSRAFLDYDGPDSLMALRAADAAQDTVYAGGKLYDVSGKNKEGKYDTIGYEMREYLKDNRNERAGGQAYKDYYQKNVVEPAQAEKPDTMAPNYSSRSTYEQMAQRDAEGTLVMGPDNKPEPFENNINQSYITGSPGQDIYNTTKNPFVDQQEPPTTGFLPDEETAETIKSFYLK